MKALRVFMFVILLSSTAFAAIITSGDAGKGWAEELAQEKCGGENVGAVYLCLGNVVKVVSTVPGAGSTFYEPDGNVAHCPLVAPSEMGAECVQMTMPNYCPGEVVCGEGEEHVFPGHSDYDEEIEGTETDETPPAEPDPEPVEVPEAPEPAPAEEPEEDDTPAPEPRSTRTTTVTDESIFDNLAFMMLLLGLVAVLVLYFLFRRTIGR